MSDDKTFLLELSTAVVETVKFTVDGTEYELYGLNHLAEADEVRVMALFSRFDRAQEALKEAANQKKAEDLARALRGLRLKLLSTMTSCPESVLGNLPLKGQIALMEAVAKEFEDDDEDAEDA